MANDLGGGGGRYTPPPRDDADYRGTDAWRREQGLTGYNGITNSGTASSGGGAIQQLHLETATKVTEVTNEAMMPTDVGRTRRGGRKPENVLKRQHRMLQQMCHQAH